MTPETAGLFGAIILLLLAAFHAALALGAPLGAYAWGGENKGVLPPRQRQGSTFMAPLLVALALMVFIRAGWLFPDDQRSMVWPVWAVFCFLVMVTFGALRSQSSEERRRMTPVLLVGTVLVGYLALKG